MSLRLSLARIGRGPRLAAAAACLLLAGVTALDDGAATPASRAGPTTPVVLAAHTFAAGHALARSDLRVARWPSGLAPPGTARAPDPLVGRVLAGPVASREPISALRLLDATLTTGLGAGTVAVPVDVDTDVTGFARPGGRVDLFAVPRPDSSGAPSQPGPAVAVATGSRVLAVLPPPDPEAGGSRVILAVSREIAVKLAGQRAYRVFSVVVAPP